MTIPIFNHTTGQVFLRSYDQGMMGTLGAVIDPNSSTDPRYIVNVDGVTTNPVSVYFAQPESIFRKKVYPFVTINRDDFTPAMNRWMGVGQLEYRSGVSGTQVFVPIGHKRKPEPQRRGRRRPCYRNPRLSLGGGIRGSVSGIGEWEVVGVSGFWEYQTKPQAIPYDIVYTVTCFDRYENAAQAILLKLLKVFPPIGKVFVSDSLGLDRTYDAYQEGAIAPLKEIIDPVTRFVGFAITVRVEGELDLADPSIGSSVTGFDLGLHRF